MMLAATPTAEEAAIKAAKAEAVALSKKAAEDEKAALEVAKAKAKAITQRGIPARDPVLATSSDVRVAPRGNGLTVPKAPLEFVKDIQQ